jgi:hypothetical protein
MADHNYFGWILILQWEIYKILKSLGKSLAIHFFKNRGAKKSKIAYKIISRQEVLKRDRVKIVLVVK